MDVIPYLETIGKLLGWPAVVAAVILGFVLRDLSRRVAKLEQEKEATSKAIEKALTASLEPVVSRLSKLESADTTITDDFKKELNKLYEKINKMSEDIAILKDRSDRTQIKAESEG